MRIEPVETDRAPRPNGHYSQAVVHGDLVYLSMHLPFTPDGSCLPAGIEAQADQVLANCEAILAAAGSGLERTLSVTLYLTDVADWAAVNGVFARRFGTHRPARAMVPVNALHHGARVGLQLIAARST